MGVEVRPLGVQCNLRCLYCYQNPERDATHLSRQYDLVKIKSAVEAADAGSFVLFGGEPLLLPIRHLEELWAWGYQKYGRNGLQTNGTLLSDDHIQLFRKYRVSVGMSIDGPGELNDARWKGTVEATRANTAKTHSAIVRLCDAGLYPAIIITLHRVNASTDRLPLLIAWVRDLAALGVTRIRLHLLESETPEVRGTLGLSTDENLAALLEFLRLAKVLPRVEFDLFTDMRRLLMGDDAKVSCIWKGCDPYTTGAVQGVEGHGQRSNCGRTNKDGIDFIKAQQVGFERYIALYHTAQEHGGCNGCRFFLMCKGQCPGTAMHGDWRYRSEHCEVWKALFTSLESECQSNGLTPLSLRPEREALEKTAIQQWARGIPVSLSRLTRPYASDGLPPDARRSNGPDSL